MKQKTAIMSSAIFCCLVMALVDGWLRPGYGGKSAIKLALFVLVPLIVARVYQQGSMKSLFRFQKKDFPKALLLGLGIYVVILGGYFVLSRFVDFDRIADTLARDAGVKKSNFLFVSLYISFVNSLLEEFFFRGFLFLNLKKLCRRGEAYLISAGLFSLYHTAMMIGWFDWWLFALVLVGLLLGGLIFNRLDEKQGTLYPSWFPHMFANFAINTVGFLLMK